MNKPHTKYTIIIESLKRLQIDRKTKIVLSGPPFSAKFIFQSEFFEWFCRVHFVVYNETFFCFGWRNGTGVARQVSISIHHIFSYEAIWWTSEKPLFRNQINVATQNLIVNKELEIFIRLLKRRNAAANQQQKQKSAHTHTFTATCKIIHEMILKIPFAVWCARRKEWFALKLSPMAAKASAFGALLLLLVQWLWPFHGNNWIISNEYR